MSKANPLKNRRWVELVNSHPEMEASCPWAKLKARGWHDVLMEHPEFIRNAPKAIPQSFMSLRQWLEVLIRHPELDAYFPAGNLLNCRSSDELCKLWGELLARHPKFAKYAPWRHLRRQDWVTVLSQQPQFLDKYGRETCGADSSREQFTSTDIAEIVACQPSLFEHFSATPFDSGDWETILCAQPQFWDSCNVQELAPVNLGRILACHPELLARCDVSAMPPRDIVAIADEFPEILNHVDLERFREIGGGDTPWIENHPSLLPYARWNFSYGYWHGLLTRLGVWMETGKRLKVSSVDNGETRDSFAPITKYGHLGGIALLKVYRRPLLPDPYSRTIRNSVDSILESRYWADQDVDIRRVPVIPEHIRVILADETLSYEKLMLTMPLHPEEDCGMLFYGCVIQKRKDFLARMMDEDLRTVVDMVPLEYLLPQALIGLNGQGLARLLENIASTAPSAIASFRDKGGNNALHYAFFRAPWRPEDNAAEAAVLQLLLKAGVAPDAPNAMGFSYRQMREALASYLRQ